MHARLSSSAELLHRATKSLMSHVWCGPLAAVKYANKKSLYDGGGGTWTWICENIGASWASWHIVPMKRHPSSESLNPNHSVILLAGGAIWFMASQISQKQLYHFVMISLWSTEEYLAQGLSPRNWHHTKAVSTFINMTRCKNNSRSTMIPFKSC